MANHPNCVCSYRTAVKGERFVIFAATYRHAQETARRHGLERHEWFYGANYTRVLGLRVDKMICGYGYQEKRDHQDMVQYLMAGGATYG